MNEDRTDNRATMPTGTARTDNPDYLRAYAADLEGTSRAYAIAADAPGLRKDCARYLRSESERLHGESAGWYDRADYLETEPGERWLERYHRARLEDEVSPFVRRARAGSLPGKVLA